MIIDKKDRVRAAAEDAKIPVAIDSVGGCLLGDVADLLAERTGTVVNFGSLGGETSDIRVFPPRSLTLKSVALDSWMQQPVGQRKADIALALRLAQEPGAVFEVAQRYSPSRIGDAVAHVGQAGRAGSFSSIFLKIRRSHEIWNNRRRSRDCGWR
jgi:NADPH:quinone reductase